MAAQAIHRVPAGIRDRTSARREKDGRKSLLLVNKENDVIKIVFSLTTWSFVNNESDYSARPRAYRLLKEKRACN